MSGAVLHADGKHRCPWPKQDDAIYVAYHDDEWGVPEYDDRALYEKTLNEVVSADDPDPNLRLQNAVAKRRAQRALTKPAMEECGFRAPPVMAATPSTGSASPASASRG